VKRSAVVFVTMGALGLIVVAGCSSEPQKATMPATGMSSGMSAATAAPKAVAAPEHSGMQPASLTSGTPSRGSAMARLSEQSVYFDFDSYSIKDKYETVIAEDFKYLQQLPARKLQLQGNADERGSREYNLALGDKRAQAVKRRLLLLGVPESRVEAVSFGKEKPRVLGHDEAAWSENRRVDFQNER